MKTTVEEFREMNDRDKDEVIQTILLNPEDCSKDIILEVLYYQNNLIEQMDKYISDEDARYRNSLR